MQQHQTQDPLLSMLWLLHILWLNFPELITITEDRFHILVKRLKGADEDLAVLKDAPHHIVNVLQHLDVLSHSHDYCVKSKSNVHSSFRILKT